MGKPADKHTFLSGGGEMGALTREKNWSATSLGAIDKWPQSLKTTLGIVLNSKFPMFLFWGKSLTCFYNDAYRPSLGNEGKHPGILGMPGAEAWPEIWHIIYPHIEQVLAGGEASWNTDQLVPIYRNGHIEDVYWTYSYSPVTDESGNVAGVFVTCTETTAAVNNRKRLEESTEQLQFAIEAAGLGTFDYNPLTGKFSANDRLKNWFNLPALNEVALEHALNAIAVNDRERVAASIQQALQFSSGGRYDIKFSIIQPLSKKEIIVHAKGIASFNEQQVAWRLNGTLQDITEQYNAEAAALTALHKITQSEKRFEAAIKAIDGILWTNNAAGEMIGQQLGWEALTGQTYETYQGYGWAEAVHPEDRQRSILTWQNAVNAKATYVVEHRVRKRDGSYGYFSARAIPVFDHNNDIREWVGIHTDITLQRLAEQEINDAFISIEKSEKKFRDTVMQAPVGIVLMKGPSFVVEMANQSYLQLVDRKEEEFVGKSIFETLPEVRETVEPLLNKVISTGIAYHANEFEVPLNRFGEKQTGFFNLLYQPLRDSAGAITGVMAIAYEVTQQVKDKFTLKESEEKFSNLVMHSPIAMTIWRGTDYVIEIANEAMTNNIWRKKPAEVIGKKALEVFPELFNQKYPALLKKVISEGVIHRETEAAAWVQGDDGMKKFYLDFEYSPLYERDGSISGIMITVNDVTRRVEDRQQLEDAEARMRLAAEGTGLATWDLNLQTRHIIYSPRLSLIFGYDENTLLTHTEMRLLIHSEDRELIVEKAFEEALKTGVYDYEARIVHPDKSIHWIRTQGKVIFDEHRQPVRMLGTMRDITGEKANEEKIQRLAAIVQSSDDAIISKSITGHITSWNDAAQKMFNYTAEEMIGNHISVLIPGERMKEEDIIIDKLKKGERIAHFESQRMTRDGRIVDVSLAISPLKDANGRVIGASKIVRDITRQKEAERLINESEQKFRLLADSMPQFIWTGETSGSLNYYNKTVIDYSGLSMEQLKNDGWLQIVHPDDREENIKQWLHSVDTGEPFLFEHRFRRHDGEYRWQLSRAIPQKDKNGNIQMWVGTSTDIDDIKKHDQQKDDFIKMASHELKTPVTTIKGYVQLLLKMNAHGKDPFLSSSLQTIDKQIFKLTKLITDLLDVTKIETGSLELNREVFPVASLVKEIAEELETTIQTHRITVRQLTDSLVLADKDRIAQVFINLFTNAIKYSPKANEVLVDITEQDGQVLIAIKDSGIGISRDDLSRVFERFYRAAGKDEKTFPGFGIGLFIVNEIIGLHQGKIWAESEKDKGSVFYVSLPVNQ